MPGVPKQGHSVYERLARRRAAKDGLSELQVRLDRRKAGRVHAMSTPQPDLAAYYRSIGDDPTECSMFGCEAPAIYFIAAQPCGPDCDHMHGIPVPMCEQHAVGHEIVGTND
jgi:hypothetical protein